jgi:hypothetical protein
MFHSELDFTSAVGPAAWNTLVGAVLAAA